MIIVAVLSVAALAVLLMVVTSLGVGGQLPELAGFAGRFRWNGEITPQALGGVLVGTVAFITAVWAIRTTRWATQAKATVDFVERLESQEIYRQRSARYRCFRRGCISLESLEQEGVRGVFNNRDLVHGHLNRWEFAGTACRRGLFDVNVMRSISATEILRDWNSARPLIDARRKAQPSAYENFQWLVMHCKAHARDGAAAGAPAAPTPCGPDRHACAGEAAASWHRRTPPVAPVDDMSPSGAPSLPASSTGPAGGPHVG